MTAKTAGVLVLATGNRHKVGEYKQLLGGLDLELRDLSQYPDAGEAEEDGDTYEVNAAKKAVHAALTTGELALADDSGLEIDALDGRPGVHSARLASTNSERLAIVMHEMAEVRAPERTARFVCAIALADPRGYIVTRRGVCEGVIHTSPLGAAGFGYDPIFYVPELGQTMAQLAPAAKNRISHRGLAVQAVTPLLEAIVVQGQDIRELEDFQSRPNS